MSNYNLEAEQCVLASMLIDQGEAAKISVQLSASDFFMPEHQEIFKVISGMCAAREPIDFVTVLERLKASGTYDDARGKTYLMQIVQMVPSVANAQAYTAIVKKTSQKRRIQGKMQTLIFEDAEPETLLPELTRIVEGESAGGTDYTKDQRMSLIRYNEELYKPPNPKERIYTGFTQLDRLAGGLLKGMLSYVGAPPSTGKTAFAVNVAEHQLAKTENRVAFFSLEMNKPQIYDRLFSSSLCISYEDIQGKNLTQEKQHAISAKLGELAEKNQFYLFDDVYGIEDIAAKVYEIKPDLVIVDYIQIVRTAERFGKEKEKIDYISSEFKQLGKRNHCHMMVLSQVARQKDLKTGKPKAPRMSDLKESGNLEAEGDYIMMLYRPWVQDKSSDYKKEFSQCLLDKNKFGNAGLINMIFRGEVQTFEESEDRYGNS